MSKDGGGGGVGEGAGNNEKEAARARGRTVPAFYFAFSWRLENLRPFTVCVKARELRLCVSTFSVEWRPATVLIWKGVSYLASAQYFTLRIGLVGQSIGQAGASQLYYFQLHVIFRKVSDPSYIKIT